MAYEPNRTELLTRGIQIAGTGSYLPGPSLDQSATKQFLRRHSDGLTDHQQDRLLHESGITTRHFAIDINDNARRESNASMAAEAGRRALEAAGWTPDDIDVLVVTTVIPDQLMPPTSTLVQERLGISNCMELEISANCTAPTKGLMIASDQIKLGRAERVLVCNSQFASFGFVPPWMNPEKMTAQQGHLRWVLSDGAAALALQAGERDIDLHVHLESRGNGIPSGMSINFGAAMPDISGAYSSGDHHVRQPPLLALKNGIRLAAEGLERMLKAFEIPGSAIDHFIPSVSSLQVARKMEQVFGKLGVRPETWRTNFTRVGYVGSVAVPIMLDEMVRSGQLRDGDLICTVAEESSKWMFAGTVFRWVA
jgi:3-oxoacyl-[acyl-carrier-protein] synthase-3